MLQTAFSDLFEAVLEVALIEADPTQQPENVPDNIDTPLQDWLSHEINSESQLITYSKGRLQTVTVSTVNIMLSMVSLITDK